MGLFCCKYRFSPERYADNGDGLNGSFAATPKVGATLPLETVPKVVWCFWTGDNELTPNRVEGLQTMEANIGIPVKLVTPATLGEYILPDHPLHPAYEHLSLVHRADYLRCYFMHHHGGGYGDIKRYKHSWKRAFARLERSDKWGLGYKEVGAYGVVSLEGALGVDLKKNWRILVGNGAYIFRPHTPVTHEWYNELMRRMDIYHDALAAHPGNILGDNEGYPIPWAGILGYIFHPLALKYHDRLLRDNCIKPSFKNYR
jgi:hypothetical protein